MTIPPASSRYREPGGTLSPSRSPRLVRLRRYRGAPLWVQERPLRSQSILVVPVSFFFLSFIPSSSTFSAPSRVASLSGSGTASPSVSPASVQARNVIETVSDGAHSDHVGSQDPSPNIIADASTEAVSVPVVDADIHDVAVDSDVEMADGYDSPRDASAEHSTCSVNHAPDDHCDHSTAEAFSSHRPYRRRNSRDASRSPHSSSVGSSAHDRPHGDSQPALRPVDPQSKYDGSVPPADARSSNTRVPIVHWHSEHKMILRSAQTTRAESEMWLTKAQADPASDPTTHGGLAGCLGPFDDHLRAFIEAERAARAAVESAFAFEASLPARLT